MKLLKQITYIFGFIILAMSIYYLNSKYIQPKLTASNLCKKSESCLYGLTISDSGALQLSYSNDGEYLLGRGFDGTRLWDTNNKYKSKSYGKSTAIATAIDGRFAIASKYNDVKIFNKAGETMLEFSVESKTDSRITKMVFIPGFDVIAMPIPSEERGKPLLTFWSTRNGEFVSKLTHQSSIDSLEASAQGLIAVGQFNGEVILWPIKDLSQSITIAAANKSVHSMAFDKSGKLLATGSLNGEIKLWNTNSGELINNFISEGEDSLISGLAISDDGKILATSTFSGLYRLWDITTGKLLESLQYPRGISEIALSPDGKHLAIALQKKVSTSKKRVRNSKSYGPKWVYKEVKEVSPAAILIRDLSELDLN